MLFSLIARWSNCHYLSSYEINTILNKIYIERKDFKKYNWYLCFWSLDMGFFLSFDGNCVDKSEFSRIYCLDWNVSSHIPVILTRRLLYIKELVTHISYPGYVQNFDVLCTHVAWQPDLCCAASYPWYKQLPLHTSDYAICVSLSQRKAISLSCEHDCW